jgi:AhpC/TSA antioxidant enzyme
VPHVLDPLVVLDPDGCHVRMGDLWASRAAVLVFVRHFGCVFCKRQVAEIAPFLQRIRHSGAELVVIGHGSVEEARAFRDEQKLACPLLTDPSRQSYCALEMRHGLSTVLSPRVLVRGLKAWRAGFRQTRFAGDPLQQGGVLIIAPGGAERFRFISHEAGDHPSPLRILSVLEAIPPRGSSRS